MERFYANIRIPRKYLEQEEVRKAILDEFAWYNCDDINKCEDRDEKRNKKIAMFSDENARCGFFELLESKLVKLKVPFDRYSSSYYECGAIFYSYRPDGKNKHFFEYGEGGRTMPCNEIRRILKESTSSDDTVHKIHELLDATYDPYVKPLEEY